MDQTAWNDVMSGGQRHDYVYVRKPRNPLEVDSAQRLETQRHQSES